MNATINQREGTDDNTLNVNKSNRRIRLDKLDSVDPRGQSLQFDQPAADSLDSDVRMPPPDLKLAEIPEHGSLKPSLKKSLRSNSAGQAFDRQSSFQSVNMTHVYQEIHRRNMLMPPKYQPTFKIRYGKKINDQKSKKLVEEVDEAEKAAYLLTALETNPLLKEICENEVLILVLNSATSQSLQ